MRACRPRGSARFCVRRGGSFSQEAEPPLDLVDPGGAGGCEVHVEAWVLGQPCPDRGRLVGVHPEDHVLRELCCLLRGHGRLGHAGDGHTAPSSAWDLWPTPGRAGGQNCDGALFTARPLSGHTRRSGGSKHRPGPEARQIYSKAAKASCRTGQAPAPDGTPRVSQLSQIRWTARCAGTSFGAPYSREALSRNCWSRSWPGVETA